MNGIHLNLNVVVCTDADDAIAKGFNWAEVPDIKPIRVEKVIVVRNGTQSGHATVDFLLQDESGQQFVFIVTSRLLKSIPD